MQGFVALPSDVQAGIIAVVLWLVSWLFTQLITLVPFLKFLEDFKEPLSLAIASQLIALLEGAVPDQFGSVAVAALQLILLVLAAFGVGSALRAKGVRAFK